MGVVEGEGRDCGAKRCFCQDEEKQLRLNKSQPLMWGIGRLSCFSFQFIPFGWEFVQPLAVEHRTAPDKQCG